MKKKIRVLNYIFIFLFTCICLYATAAPIDTNEAILAEINAYRSEHGLEPLKMNKIISEVATSHSLEMAENRVSFGHGGFKKRMSILFERFEHPHGFAENVAMTYANAKTVVKMWLNSPGHRRNIEGNFNLTGIGRAYDKNGSVYVTQIFISAGDTSSLVGEVDAKQRVRAF